MKKVNINFVDSNKFKGLIIFFSILIFTIPISLFGIMDLEDYYYGFFSSYILSVNKLNLFLFFSDSIGPGISFPMGNGIFFNPLLVFAKNPKIFYFLITIFHLLLQIFYFIKINKLLKIKHYVIFFVPLIIFSNTNFNSHYSDDWITATSVFSFTFPVSYYFLKIIKKNFFKDYTKFLIFFFLFIENGHVGYNFFSCLFLATLFIFSENKKKILKSYKPYLCFVILIFLLLEKFYYLGSIFLYSNLQGEINSSFYTENPGINELASSFFPSQYFRSINRLPSNPYLTILSLFLILFFKRKKTFINLTYIFLVVLIFNFTGILRLFSFIMSGAWWVRDFTLIISCLVCLQYFDKIKSYLKVSLIILLLSYSLFYFGKNLSGISRNSNNFIVDKPQSLSMINFFKSLKVNKNFNRVYLSPEAYELLDRNNSAYYGIYTSKDLVKYNLIPFNVNFKNNISTIAFKKQGISYYYSQIVPKLEDLKNLFFLSLFNINFTFLSENELNLLDSNNYKIMDKIEVQNKKFYFIENNISLLAIKDPEDLRQKVKKCQKFIIECLNNEKNSFYKTNAKFIKKENSYYKIELDKNSTLYPVLPFIYDKNWRCNNTYCQSISNFLTFAENNNKVVEIRYKDTVRALLRSISLFILTILLISLRFNFKKKLKF